MYELTDGAHVQYSTGPNRHNQTLFQIIHNNITTSKKVRRWHSTNGQKRRKLTHGSMIDDCLCHAMSFHVVWVSGIQEMMITTSQMKEVLLTLTDFNKACSRHSVVWYDNLLW
jgi:hypothetical protein